MGTGTRLSIAAPAALGVALALLGAVCLMDPARADGPKPPAETQPAASSAPARTQPAATSRTDPFLKSLRQAVAIELPGERRPFVMVRKAIDWDRLDGEARKAGDPAVRDERLKYVEFWKRMAETYDYGMMCQRPNVFEWRAGELLAGTPPSDNRLPYADAGLPKGRACEYLLAEDLPGWAASLRLCAAGVLAGDGDERGMRVLLDRVRAGIKAPRGFGAVHECLRLAWTERALPLWAAAARDADPAVRRLVAGQVEHVPSGRAIPILLGLQSDADRQVRLAAAMALMRRGYDEAAPVLLAWVRGELDGQVGTAHGCAPICLQLQQWGVAGVPWEKVEAVLTDEAHKTPRHYWQAVEVAGNCLAAGRRKAALPFLTSAVAEGMKKADLLPALGSMPAQDLAVPWHAAEVLAANGRAEGLGLIGKYIEVGKDNWGYAYGALAALAAFLNRPDVPPQDRRTALAIAARAVQRRDVLFQGYFYRAIEALGEMGALVRVERRGQRLSAEETIALPYDRPYGPSPSSRYMIAEIYRARLRSVAVSAERQGIALPPDWLARYAKGQRDAIGALTDTALGPTARAALKELAAAEAGQDKPKPEDQPRTLKPDPAKSFATLAGDAEFVVCIMGDGWALRAHLPRQPKAMPRGEYHPRRCRLYRGEKIDTYIRPPAGPVPPPPPGDGRCSIDKVADLVVTVGEVKEAREPDGWVEVSFSAFSAGERRYGPTGPIRLRLVGPRP